MESYHLKKNKSASTRETHPQVERHISRILKDSGHQDANAHKNSKIQNSNK